MDAFRFVADDVLFFRDGKPSSLGDDHFHRSIFPPHPATLYGALRTRRLMDMGVDLSKLRPENWNELVPPALREEIGTPRSHGTLSLTGPWLTRRVRDKDEIWLAAPSDIGVIGKPGRVERVVRYRPQESSMGEWSHRFHLVRPYLSEGSEWRTYTVPPEKDDARSSRGLFVNRAGMEKWLDGRTPAPEELVYASDLWKEEVRTGVGLMELSRTSERSKLYTFGFIRPMPAVSIGFEVSESLLQAGVPIFLGGEGRSGMLHDGPALKLDSRPPASRFTLYLGTPSIFRHGSIPDSIDLKTYLGTVRGVPCRLIAVINHGYELIGGWDVALRRPKPLRRAMPAGTVLIFERAENQTAIADADFASPDLLKQGFSLGIVGISH